MNSRLDALQAAILAVKLRRLDDDNARRAAIAASYDAGLRRPVSCLPARPPRTRPMSSTNTSCAIAARDALRAALARRGIGTGIHYPVPVHRQPAYARSHRAGSGGLGASERAAAAVLSLPIYPQLGAAAARRVVAALKDALREIG